MRGPLAGLEAPTSLAEGIPSLLLDSELAAAVVSAFDEMFAPIFSTIDCFEAYLDPATTPADFLPWLASWVGMALSERWSEDRQRGFVAQAVDLYRWRGTARGIKAAVAAYAGVEPDIEDSGAVVWGRQPGGDIPGEPTLLLVVRVPAGDDLELDPDAIERIVIEAKPVHVPHRIELVAAP